MPEGQPDNQVSTQELMQILEQLHQLEPEEPISDDVTIEAIAEVTGESPEHIQDILDKIREEDTASRIIERLREMERPLYSVERPTTERPAVNQIEEYYRRTKPLATILDDLHRGIAKRKSMAKQKPKVATNDKGHEWLGLLVLVVFFALSSYLIWLGVASLR